MSLLSSMRTGVSGMNAQSVRISAVSENIANVSTTGFKRESVEFSSLLGVASHTQYESGTVATHIRHSVLQQGGISRTGNATDLAIQGEGFFIVGDGSNQTLLTRSGSFAPDASGRLVNSGGFALKGYQLGSSGAPGDVLMDISLPSGGLVSSPSRNGKFAANLPALSQPSAPTSVPSANTSNASWHARSSLVMYGNVGNTETVDLYFAKTADNSWELSGFDRAQSSGGGFPYSAGPLFVQALDFDGSGKLASPMNTSFLGPGGLPFSLSLEGMTQLASPFSLSTLEVDGNAPARPERFAISSDGVVSTVYGNGLKLDTFKIPLARVPSPTNLLPVSGTAFALSRDSGDVQVGLAGADGRGSIVAGSLEGSTVDLADELTIMIESQRNYTANSKVFQTSSELLDVLNRL